jgi:hypothetical protein
MAVVCPSAANRCRGFRGERMRNARTIAWIIRASGLREKALGR